MNPQHGSQQNDDIREPWEDLLVPASDLLEAVPLDLSGKVQKRIRRHVIRRRVGIASATLGMVALISFGVSRFDFTNNDQLAGPVELETPSPHTVEPETNLVRFERAEVTEIRDAIAVPVPYDSDRVTIFQIYPTIQPTADKAPDSSHLRTWETETTFKRS